MSLLQRLFPRQDPLHFVTSKIFSPIVLACIRLTFSAYIFSYLIYRIAYSATNDGSLGTRQSFSYFTNITYWSLGFYFAVSGVHTLVYALKGRALLERWGAVLQELHSVFYSSVVTFPFLVTIVYWGILAPDESPFLTVVSGYSNVSGHLLNSVFALFEIVVPRTEPLPWGHILFLILFLGGYLGVAYITKATQGFYTYGFLNPDTGTGKVVGYCFGIFAAICVVFCVVHLLIWGRVKLTKSMKPKFAKGDLREKADVEKGLGRGVEVSKH